jgi:PIN domain nuclease of toxin-antitoxin system
MGLMLYYPCPKVKNGRKNDKKEGIMADFFPKREADLLEWFKNFSAVLVSKASAWNILVDVANDLLVLVNEYETIFELAKGENGTKALILEKHEKRDALIATVRNIKNKYIDYNDIITNPDRERLGLPVRDRNPTPKPKPVGRPLLKVRPTNNRQHTITAINQETGKKTKPENVHGVRFVWEIRDTAPTNADDLRRSVFRIKTVEVFDYSEEDRGKKVFYAACYENAKGDAGPWSDIVEAIIP